MKLSFAPVCSSLILVTFLATVGFIAAGSAIAAESHAADAPKADATKGEQLFSTGDEKRGLPACTSCHGPSGNSVGAPNPKLAGQHPEYLYKQLANFRVKKDAAKAERENPIMGGFAAMLTEEEMHNVAAYLAKQTLKPAAARNKDTVAFGQKIYRAGIAEKNVPACAGCHSPNGAGIPAQFPRLGGQFADYAEAQLVAFRSGTRHNSAQMTAISARLSDAEIKAVSDYVAGLR